MVDTVTVEMRRSLVVELEEILDAEVATADEIHSTEQVMQEGAEALRRALEGDADPVPVELRQGLAEELAEVLETEVAAADEFQSTEQAMEEAAETIRSQT